MKKKLYGGAGRVYRGGGRICPLYHSYTLQTCWDMHYFIDHTQHY